MPKLMIFTGETRFTFASLLAQVRFIYKSVTLYKYNNMIREIVVPTQNTYVLHLPDNLIGKSVEIIAFSNDDIAMAPTHTKSDKRTAEQAIAFYTKHEVDFSKIEKWNREDLYE